MKIHQPIFYRKNILTSILCVPWSSDAHPTIVENSKSSRNYASVFRRDERRKAELKKRKKAALREDKSIE